MRAVITAVGHFVSDRKLTNNEIEKMVDTNDDWIISRTGIKERRILDKGIGTSYMAVKAANQVLEQKNISAQELDLIIVATVTPDMLVPATVAFVQKELNATNCWGFDLNGGCTGFVCALATASQFIETGKCQKVLVIGSDKMSAITDYEDRNTCILFGDAAGAVLIEPLQDENYGIMDFMLHLNGEGHKYLNIPAGGSLEPASHKTVDNKMHYLRQDGRAVFKQAVTHMASVTEKIMKKYDFTGKDIKFLIPHQANYRIIDAVAKKLKLDKNQVIINIEKYGNTTAASIPLALSEANMEKK